MNSDTAIRKHVILEGNPEESPFTDGSHTEIVLHEFKTPPHKRGAQFQFQIVAVGYEFAPNGLVIDPNERTGWRIQLVWWLHRRGWNSLAFRVGFGQNAVHKHFAWMAKEGIGRSLQEGYSPEVICDKELNQQEPDLKLAAKALKEEILKVSDNSPLVRNSEPFPVLWERLAPYSLVLMQLPHPARG